MRVQSEAVKGFFLFRVAHPAGRAVLILAVSYTHLNELGLITNCPLKVVVRYKDNEGKTHTEEKNYTAERTAFTTFNEAAVKRIKEDIANRTGIAVNDVDLAKFVHMRTTLSIPKHREIVEQEMGSFLQEQYPKITLDSVKTIYRAMMDLLCLLYTSR